VTNEQLKPCPFCGGEAHATPAHGPTRMPERVACLVCAAELSGTGAIEQWQARAQLAAPAGVVLPERKSIGKGHTDAFVAAYNLALYEVAQLNAAAPSPAPTSGVYAADPLACSGCVSGCFRCSEPADALKPALASDVVQVPRELASRLTSTDNHVRQTARRELRNMLLSGGRV
jgi:hypothetical protein